jgi:phosphoribosylformimino-5-aminoimidazole carboxamide ribotide isomerase
VNLYARVNILDGRAVRLPTGDVTNAVALDADPIGRAQGWISKGANRLLVVDLDAAAYGNYGNRSLIDELVAAVDVPVVVAGGVRSQSEVDRLLASGAAQVSMGTVAVVDQVLLWDLCRDHPGRILISLDVKPNEELAIRGWTEHSGSYLEEVLIEVSSAGAAGFMIAEVGRDALKQPTNHSFLRTALRVANPDEQVIAAGGVMNLDDLQDLQLLEVDGKKVTGVVVGREVTEGRFTVEEAVKQLAG